MKKTQPSASGESDVTRRPCSLERNTEA